MSEVVEIVGLDGRTYAIPAAYSDLFFDGRTGEPISDAAWDEQIRRIREFEPDFKVT